MTEEDKPNENESKQKAYQEVVAPLADLADVLVEKAFYFVDVTWNFAHNLLDKAHPAIEALRTKAYAAAFGGGEEHSPASIEELLDTIFGKADTEK